MPQEADKKWELVILRSALADINDGYQFYEKQAEGLGSYFEESVFSEIDALHDYAGIHHKAYDYYRLPLKKFPYAAYYKIEDDTVKIQAILDCRQDPLRTQIRLSGD